MPLRPNEQCWLPELDHHDPETRRIGVTMLSVEDASPEALMEVADLVFDGDTNVRRLVFDRLLNHPAVPQQVEAVAYRFVRRVDYAKDKRNYILALQLLMRANPHHWRDLVAKQINLILAHEKYEPVKALAYGIQAMIEEKKK